MSGAKKSVRGSRGPPVAEASEVEEMLRAAEDELLMELHVGSHTISSSSSSSSLDSDLSRRFEALKSPRLPPHRKASQAIPPPQSPIPESKALESRDQIHGDAASDDLMARFAALKGPIRNLQPMENPISNRVDFSADEEEIEDGDEVSKKEVEKVMQWAMDAARLDASRSDDEDNDIVKENDAREEEDKEESESETEVEETNRRVKEKGKSSKWFSLFR